MVELRGVSVAYPLPRGGHAQAVKGASAVFEEGCFGAIIGPSGCGKTSLVRAIAGLVAPSEGEVLVGSSAPGARRGRAAVIFQDYCLLPWKTVFANAELPLRLGSGAAGSKKAGREKVESLLAEFGLERHARRYPSQLSGGMKQRVAIVRALVAEPELLLMDEPFSSLDALSREDAQDFVLSVQRERRLTVVMVTHSIEEAAYLADSIHVMGGSNPGEITARFEIRRDAGAPRAEFRGHPRFHEYCGALRGALAQGRAKGGKAA